MRNCQWYVFPAWSTKYCPAPKVMAGMNYVGYGSGYSDHDLYCCEPY